MPIAVFDIDGTLTDTSEVDIECYEAAIRSEIGVEIPSDWPSFDDVTDATILAVACERQGVPMPDSRMEQRIAARVGGLLALALREEGPRRFRPVAGAREIFAALEGAGWRVAIATGAWRPSAVVKLEGARIPYEGVPLASASDHRERREIIRHAVRALPDAEGEPVVYFGDGVWDGRAARALGYGFVGVGLGSRVRALESAGAAAVIADFADTASVLRHLHELIR